MKIKLQTALGDRIKRAREAKEWSLDELADAMTGSGSRDSATLGDIERGEIQRPPDDVLESIARALDISADELKRLRPSAPESRSPFGVRADGSTAIRIDTDIGEDFFGGGITADSVRNAIEATISADPAAVDVHLLINSFGGDPFEAVAINAVLDRHRAETGGRVIAEVAGIAASAAVNLTSNADEVLINDGSQMMIHHASSMTFGNTAAHERTIAVLTRVDDAISRLHARKTGKTVAEVVAAMDVEQSFDAFEAVAFGLADRVISEIKVAAHMNAWRANPKYQEYLAKRPKLARKETMDHAQLAAMLGLEVTASAKEVSDKLAKTIGQAATVENVTALQVENETLRARVAELEVSASLTDCESRITAMIAEGRLSNESDPRVQAYRNVWQSNGEETAEIMANTWPVPKALGKSQHKSGDKAGQQGQSGKVDKYAAFAKLNEGIRASALHQEAQFGRNACIDRFWAQFPAIAAQHNVDMTEVN